MSKRKENSYKRCPRCKIQFSLCFCDHFQKYPNTTPISILMHFKELPLSSNTAILTQENLSNCRIYLRGHPESERNKSIELLKEKKNLVLFPDENAIDIKEFKGEDVHLIIPDGSWRQAKKFKRREAKLQDLQTVKVNIDHTSEYLLRKQINEYGLCTLEAIAYALSELEGNDVKEHLLAKLKVLNERVLISRGTLRKNLID